MTERDFAFTVVQKLQNAGFQALWAGGCVRDELLGLAPKDYDIATDALPDQVRRLFKRTLAIGASFGVVEVLGPRRDGKWLKVQVATFRSDGTYSDGRHPDHVTFSTPQEDARRRDFTINGMFFDPIGGRYHDYVGGRKDLEDKILRAIGDPAKRFEEDKLRLLRAVRMATRFDLQVEAQTAAAIRKMAQEINVVSAERIAEELRELLVHSNRERGLRLLNDLGLTEALFPELPPQFWEQTRKVVAALTPSPSFPLALAALLHKVCGGEAQVEKIADRLRLSRQEKKRASWLVAHQRSLLPAKSMRQSELKRILVHPGIGELLALHRAIANAGGTSAGHIDYCEGSLARWSEDELQPQPLITGDDLKRFGCKPGPHFKKVLDAVYDAQLEGSVATKAEAEKLARAILGG